MLGNHFAQVLLIVALMSADQGVAKQWTTLLDQRLPEFEKLLQPGDVVIVTADHGCDPTFAGTDHTREYIPVLVFGSGIKPGSIGKRETFADIGQSLAQHFGLKPFEYGKSFL